MTVKKTYRLPGVHGMGRGAIGAGSGNPDAVNDTAGDRGTGPAGRRWPAGARGSTIALALRWPPPNQASRDQIQRLVYPSSCRTSGGHCPSASCFFFNFSCHSRTFLLA